MNAENNQNKSRKDPDAILHEYDLIRYQEHQAKIGLVVPREITDADLSQKIKALMRQTNSTHFLISLEPETLPNENKDQQQPDLKQPDQAQTAAVKAQAPDSDAQKKPDDEIVFRLIRLCAVVTFNFLLAVGFLLLSAYVFIGDETWLLAATDYLFASIKIIAGAVAFSIALCLLLYCAFYTWRFIKTEKERQADKEHGL